MISIRLIGMILLMKVNIIYRSFRKDIKKFIQKINKNSKLILIGMILELIISLWSHNRASSYRRFANLIIIRGYNKTFRLISLKKKLLLVKFLKVCMVV